MISLLIKWSMSSNTWVSGFMDIGKHFHFLLFSSLYLYKELRQKNARIESERALKRAVISMMADNMELFKQYNDNPSFNKWLSDMVFLIL